MRSPQCTPMLILPCYHGDSVHKALHLCNISYGLFWNSQTCTCMFLCTAEFLSIRVTCGLWLSTWIMLLVWLRGQKQPQCLFLKTFSFALLLSAWAGGITGLDNLDPAVYRLFPSPTMCCVWLQKSRIVYVWVRVCACVILFVVLLQAETKKKNQQNTPGCKNPLTGINLQVGR